MTPECISGLPCVDPSGNCFQPGLAVGIVERNSGMDFGNVRRRMQIIAFFKSPAEAGGEFTRDSGFLPEPETPITTRTDAAGSAVMGANAPE